MLFPSFSLFGVSDRFERFLLSSTHINGKEFLHGRESMSYCHYHIIIQMEFVCVCYDTSEIGTVPILAGAIIKRLTDKTCPKAIMKCNNVLILEPTALLHRYIYI